MEFWKNDRWKKMSIFLLLTAGVILFFKYVFWLCWPLLIAIVVVAPIYDRLWMVQQKTHISKSVLAGVLVILGTFFFFLCLGGLLYAVIQIGVNNIDHLGKIEKNCILCTEAVCQRISDFSGFELYDVKYTLHQGLQQLSLNFNSHFFPKILEKSVISFRLIFTFFAVFMITVMLIVLLMKEYGQWRNFIYSNDSITPVLRVLKRVQQMIKEYIKAELCIMLTITGIVVIGMLLVPVEHPFLYAVITGFMDALPFIGTGLVLFPFMIWFVLEHNYLAAGIILGIYIICVIARELLEPKLISSSMKISAVGVLVSIFAGLKIYGLMGVLLGPLTFVILIECYQEIYGKKI